MVSADGSGSQLPQECADKAVAEVWIVLLVDGRIVVRQTGDEEALRAYVGCKFQKMVSADGGCSQLSQECADKALAKILIVLLADGRVVVRQTGDEEALRAYVGEGSKFLGCFA